MGTVVVICSYEWKNWKLGSIKICMILILV